MKCIKRFKRIRTKATGDVIDAPGGAAIGGGGVDGVVVVVCAGTAVVVNPGIS